MKSNQITLTFSSIAENVSIARLLIASIGGQLDLSLNDIEELKVAVSEAVSNAIIHGYQSVPNNIVYLDLEIADDTLIIVVKDEGCGISNVEQAMQPAYSTDPERMGLGFVFMQSFMDELQVESKLEVGTTVTMKKRFKQTPISSH
ncbi:MULTISPECIES: anti-sigma F factor [Desulfosporosinus]|uniref:Anti-sigma F factor n=1 Tax=Desulfosporosinus lacus DSM 15449 TaxID=1121420 RepID=A0A1M5YYM1_9FIRM|nr:MULTISPECIES: anti-sigma F factor [Desulfosporosinus]MCB8816465.1 anti-sigma F factor [Desulfosporosinus sp. SRJS8]SHI16964.1 stage II sporulation protein AB (anti-sigma F factor) [Desulfosporosinus lacus DSM 15449]